MNEPLPQYLTHLDLECGYSVNTVASYRRVLIDFLAFLSRRHVSLRRFRPRDLHDYVRTLRDERANCATTIRLKLQAVKSFLNYLEMRRKGPRDASMKKHDFRYKIERHEADSLSASQLRRLLDAVHTQPNRVQESASSSGVAKRLFAARRDVCLFTLLASTGVRIAEALGIKLIDIDAADKSIRILGKGKKYRTIFCDLPALEQALENYLVARRALEPEHDVLFVSTKAYRPLQARGAQKLLKSYLRKAGLSDSITPHSLRHTFATLAIERGANIKAVSQILGHANCSITVNLYTHLSNEHLREVMQKCSPFSPHEIPVEERIHMRRQHLAYVEKTG